MSPSSWKEFSFPIGFQGGYNSDLDPEVLPPHFISSGQRINWNRGLISKGDGRQLFSAGPFQGTVNDLWVFQLSSGTAFLIAVSTTNLYRYNVGPGTWTDITPLGGLHGTVTFKPQCITWNDKFYCTNGTDPILQWDGIAPTASFITGSGAPSACSSIVAFAGFLFAIRPTVGTLFGFRVMWSDFLTPTVWNAGQAGAVDLNDSSEQLLTGLVMGRWLTLYKTSIVYNVVFVGPPVYFDFRRIETPGTAARRTVAQILMLGLFAQGRDDEYIFDQSQSRPIGRPVRQEILAKMDWQGADAAFAWVRPDVGRVYLHLPFNRADHTPDNVYSYSYQDGPWMPEGPYPATAGIYAEFTSNLTVSQLTGPINTYNLTIDELTRLNQRQPLVTDGTNIYYLAAVANDYATPTAAAISSNFTTAEVPLEVQNGKPVPCYVSEVLVTGNSGGNVSVTLNGSIGNETYVSSVPYAVTLSGAMRVPIPVELYAERFSVSIVNNTINQGYAVKEISLRYRPRPGRV